MELILSNNIHVFIILLISIWYEWNVSTTKNQQNEKLREKKNPFYFVNKNAKVDWNAK